MNDVDLCHTSISDLGRLLERREVSPVEVARAYLDRIARLNPKLHAFATVTADLALEQAKEAEREIARGRRRGPLHGIPVAVKDLCYTRGVVSAAGMPIHAGFRPEYDATVVARLRAQGAVLLGKTQMTEGAMADHHPDIAVPVNPWNPAHWAGASSSGSGVATASGLCAASLGSDTGGSIRFPSAMNGVTGIKPTWGRVSRYGVFDLGPSLDHIGPMARSAEDAGIVLDAISGWDENDPTSLAEPATSSLALPSEVSGWRIGLDPTASFGDAAPIVERAVRDAVTELAALGAEIVEVELPSAETLVVGGEYCAPEAALVHASTFPARAAEYGPSLRAFLEGGAQVTGLRRAELDLERRDFSGRLAALFENERLDLLAVPVLADVGMTAARLSAMVRNRESFAGFLRFTAPFNFSGNPTITLPCGFEDDGVPIGFQLVAPHLREDRLVAAGRAFQIATDWHRQRPPV